MLVGVGVPRTLSTCQPSPGHPLPRPQTLVGGDFLLSFLPPSSDSLCQLPPFNITSPCVVPLPDAPALCVSMPPAPRPCLCAPLYQRQAPAPVLVSLACCLPFLLCRAPASAWTPLACTPRQCPWLARCVDASPACALHQCSFSCTTPPLSIDASALHAASTPHPVPCLRPSFCAAPPPLCQRSLPARCINTPALPAVSTSSPVQEVCSLAFPLSFSLRLDKNHPL